MTHKKLLAQGGTVHYWINKKKKDADCIVFTHGLTADHTMFARQAAYFSKKYTTIFWDVPMHGLSRPYKNFSYHDTAKILYDILQSEKLSKVILVGMSMGGYPSQHFAARYPDMVKGFVALDTTPLGLQYYSKFDLWWLEHAAPMANWFPAALLRKSIAWSVSRTRYSYHKMLSMLAPLSKAELIEQLRIAYENFALENQDITLTAPVLLLVGDQDCTGKVKSYCKAWAKQTGCTLHYIKNAKHFSNGDNPEQVNTEIEHFIKNINR